MTSSRQEGNSWHVPLFKEGLHLVFLSVNVYDCLIDRMASVQSEKWASFIKHDFLRQSMERVKFSLLCIMF